MAIQNILEAYGSDLVGAHVQVGGGGHEIMNQLEQILTQRPTLQMMDIHTSDDSVHLRTELEVIKKVTKAEFDTLGVGDDGFYMTTDEEDISYTDPEADKVEVTGDGVKTASQLLSELTAKVDFTKITENAKIVTPDNVVLFIRNPKTNPASFIAGYCTGSAPFIYESLITIGSTIAFGYSTPSAYASQLPDVPASGTKFTLYYGTSSSIINLKTDAENCMMSDGVTSVADAFIFADITSQCTLYSGLSSAIVLYNKTLKMVRVQGILASGTPNGTTVVTLPNTIKANGVQLLAQKYDTSDGKTITCVISDNSSNIVTEYSLSTSAGVAQVITAFIMCK